MYVHVRVHVASDLCVYVRIPAALAGCITMGLYVDVVLITAENFRALLALI